MTINEEFAKLRAKIELLNYEIQLGHSLLKQWIEMERDLYEGDRAYIDCLNETDQWIDAHGD